MLIRYRTFSAVLLAIVSFAAPYASRLVAQDVLHGWTVTQKTAAVVLEKVEEGPGSATTLLLRNVSGKSITAIATSSPPGTNGSISHFLDYLDMSSAGLANGAIYGLKIGPEEAISNVRHVFEIDAVIFEDGTADGLPWGVDFINAARLGRAFETERINGLLAGSNTPSPDLGTLAASIGALPDSMEQALDSLKSIDYSRLSLANISGPGGEDNRRAFLSGVRQAREEALWQIKEIAGLPAHTSADSEAHTQSASMLALKQAYEAKLNMYRGYGQRLLGRSPQ